MESVSIQEAQARLADLIHRLTPGDELVIIENEQPVARLLASTSSETSSDTPRRLGSLRGTVRYMAPDFDAPLEDFQEYME
jgi:antitoxin (DNA-binding transcriptional repressor) of toxin-antitoxin stability system